VLGDDIIVGDGTDLYTSDPEARITIGDRTYHNGPRFSCVRSIEIGPDCILADTRILDTDFHAVGRDRRSKSAPVRTAPVVVERNVWIAAGSAVLKGVRIGEDAVVAFGALVTADVPPGKVVGGNPARVLGDVP
jgi:acetyltransferase-like isoleucine patch superfamily enzyme